MGNITTHILDTSLGKPAQGVKIKLLKLMNDSWEVIGEGLTNADGRLPGLLPDGKSLEPGEYRMWFDTDSYFASLGQKSIYPSVSIDFRTFDTTHYHVPLLLNPFGYSTYRGS